MGRLSRVLCASVVGESTARFLSANENQRSNTLSSATLESALSDGLPSFESFLQTWGRSYVAGSTAYDLRQAIYEQRREQARYHNSKANRRWTAGPSEHWDWTDDELSGLVGGHYNRGEKSVDAMVEIGEDVVRDNDFGGNDESDAQALDAQPSELPESVNWAHLSSISSIKNQGACGSCWAVTAATVLDGHNEIYGSGGTQFSAQDLVNCVPNPRKCGGDGGCQGATTELALDWAMRQGVASESEVRYRGEDGQCGHASSSYNSSAELTLPGTRSIGQWETNSFKMTGWKRMPENEYVPLLRAVYEHGPVGTSVAADDWFQYKSGIFDGCSKDAILNHAVTLEGYGVDASSKDKYWIIQNSWGGSWGEHGRIRLLRSKDEAQWCGVDNKPEQGSACPGGPSEIRVCGMCGILYDNAVPLFEGDGNLQLKQAAYKQSM